MLCLRIFVLITLRTILNAIVYCLLLNTGRGADANPKVDFLGIDACWIAVYVLCRNALIKSHSTHHDICMCIVMPSLFVNCPTVICSPNMLFLIGETPLVNCGPRSNSLHLNTIYCKHCSLLFFANKHHLPHYTINPLFTASRWDWQPHCYVGAKYFDCVVQVPRWRRNPWCCAALHSVTINLQRASWLLLVR